MVGGEHHFVTGPFVNFDLPVPLTSVQYREHCRLSQAVDLFVQTREPIRFTYGDGVQLQAVDAESEQALFRECRYNSCRPFDIWRLQKLVDDHSSSFHFGILSCGWSYPAWNWVDPSYISTYQIDAVFRSVYTPELFMPHALRFREHFQKCQLLLVKIGR